MAESDPESSAQPTDEFLLKCLQEGNSDSIGELFIRYSRMVHVIARRVLHDTGEAEDLVQEVFLFILTKCQTFDPTRGTFRNWLIQIAYHRAYDRRRYLNARSFYDTAEFTIDRASDTSPSVESVMISQATLRSAFRNLGEEQRRAVVLFFYQGYTIREISQAMNRSEGNVQHYLYRGLNKLRLLLFGRRPKKSGETAERKDIP